MSFQIPNSEDDFRHKFPDPNTLGEVQVSIESDMKMCGSRLTSKEVELFRMVLTEWKWEKDDSLPDEKAEEILADADIDK